MIRKGVGVGQGDEAVRTPLASVFTRLLAAARWGNVQSLGVLLQSFRPYLLSIASRGLPSRLRGKCDASDLVQETLLEAHRGFAEFNGTDSDDLRLWLRGILKHNLKDVIRRYGDTSKRSVGRERSLEAGLELGENSGGATDPCPTPSSVFIARDSASALREALSRLPADERFVIVLRHFESLSFQEVGHRLDRSSEAARKLCARAIVRLQHMLGVGRGTDR
jgi:RNA polymerase sigma-70 factor, ECF subfamily